MYPLLRRGDKLPTVAVIQILLNRKMKVGTYIGVDGIFGKFTQKAVRNFQKEYRLPNVNGVIDRETWLKLSENQPFQLIDSVDVTNHKDLGYEDAAIKSAGGDPIINFGMCAGVAEVKHKIRIRATNGSVGLLRFHGHGSPGSMGITTGTGWEADSTFDALYIKFLARFISELSVIFSPFGSVELHGCRVGAGRDGTTLLKGLANALGVPVSAGVRTQYGGGATTFRFEGYVKTEFPKNKSLKAWAKSLPAPEIYGMSVSRAGD